MLTPDQIKDQINRLIRYLVEISLSNIQYYAFQRQGRGNAVEITFDNAGHVPIALKDLPYNEIYKRLVDADAYNVKMLDGALIQMMYAFSGGMLQSHRLAFFPAPHLEEYQNNPDVYRDDEIYADVIARNIVPFPVRFDYNARDSLHQKLVHPKSHLTLGQYENCRIPVTAPMTPLWFIDFILRNFYNTADERYTDDLLAQSGAFAESILPVERGVVHMVVPA